MRTKVIITFAFGMYVNLQRWVQKHFSELIMKKIQTIHNLRLVTCYALIGSVLTGAAFGWMPTAFDWRIVGASFGVIIGLAISHWEKSSTTS